MSVSTYQSTYLSNVKQGAPPYQEMTAEMGKTLDIMITWLGFKGRITQVPARKHGQNQQHLQEPPAGTRAGTAGRASVPYEPSREL
jgi:hypothetical protein